MDMYTHLPRWIHFYQSQIGRELQPDDYLFPYIAPNGVLDPKREMKHDMFARMMKQLTDGANLSKSYTTHSFRRGGAQYRFIYAPLQYRWTLNRVRWWGGWAVGESVSSDFG